MAKQKHYNKYLQTIQADIDLHEHTRQEAVVALREFLEEAREKNYKKIRIITGKGLHSAEGKGVLKGYVEKILESEGLKYSDAKLYEGGSGAIDVDLN